MALPIPPPARVILPELCILKIFNKLSVKDVVIAGMANQHMNEMSRETLRKRKSLLVVLEEEANQLPIRPDFNLIDFSSLSIEHLDNACNWMSCTFPNLVNLGIVLPEKRWQVARILPLLRQCGDKLEQVELFFMHRYDRQPDVEAHIHDQRGIEQLVLGDQRLGFEPEQLLLFDTLNLLPALEAIVCRVDITCEPQDIETRQSIQLPTLSQLEPYCFETDFIRLTLELMMKYYVPNNRPTDTELGLLLGRWFAGAFVRIGQFMRDDILLLVCVKM